MLISKLYTPVIETYFVKELLYITIQEFNWITGKPIRNINKLSL